MKPIPVRHMNAPLKEPGFPGSFYIRDISAMLSDNALEQELHRHSFFFLLALEHAAGAHSIDFTSFPVEEPCVFLMRPGQVHSLSLAQGSKGFMMELGPDFYTQASTGLAGLLRKISRCNYFPLTAAGYQELKVFLELLLQEQEQQQTGYTEARQAALQLFLVGLQRQSLSFCKMSENIPSFRRERLEELLDLLEQHLLTQKQVSWYAAQLHLTPYQLNAVTKDLLGKTCSEVINDQILLEARRQLLAGSDPISQVAGLLGYEDVSYFIRFFKKHTGYSPYAFRHNFR